MDYTSALSYIHAVQWVGHRPGLDRTRTLLAALGDPHKALRFVHVAGTNGKGSTAAMLAACLQAAGYRVGLFNPLPRRPRPAAHCTAAGRLRSVRRGRRRCAGYSLPGR